MDRPDSNDELLPCVDFTGPRRVLRILYGAALALGAAALASLGVIETDVVVRGEAVVVPVGETARVQSVRGGTVREILVRDGDRVERGRPILRFDGAALRARLEMLAAEEEAAAARVATLEVLARSRESVFDLQREIRRVEGGAAKAKGKAATELIEARERERDIRAKDEEIARKLVETQVRSQKDLDTAVIDAKVAAAQAEAARAALRDAESSLRKLGLERALLQRESELAKLSDTAVLAEAKAELMRLRGDIAAAKVEESQLEIVAPRSGVVQGLAVNDPGDVVAPGDIVAQVVPAADDLVVQARVPSDGIAFVWPGQEVRLKVDAYPFQDFGVFRGEVVRIASDTTSTERGGRREGVYVVELKITSAPARPDPEPVRLRFGMTGQAELTVRRETLLATLTRPFRGVADSVRH